MSNVARVDALQEEAEKRIFTVRGCQVILDSDLAEFYGVLTGMLNRQAKRNEARFPADFRFQLSQEEYDNLMCQNGISRSEQHGGRRKLPWAYTAKGALTAAGVLKTKQADDVAVAVARAFESMTTQLHQLSGIVERLERLEDSSVTREELAGVKDEILNALKGLGGAVRDVERRLPKQLKA